MKECIRSTNKEVFGGMYNSIRTTISTSRGWLTIAHFVITANVCILVGGTGTYIIMALSNQPPSTMTVLGIIAMYIVTVVSLFVTIMYSVTLYDNCSSGNGE